MQVVWCGWHGLGGGVVVWVGWLEIGNTFVKYCNIFIKVVKELENFKIQFIFALLLVLDFPFMIISLRLLRDWSLEAWKIF